MDEILVTIITVCKNSEKTIGRTIESVLNQTYGNIEYIIIDGVSEDGTLNIINQYKSRFKEKIRVISEPDNGLYDAMNKGINMAKGEIVGIVNSDDFYESDTVENILQVYRKGNKQIIYGLARILDHGVEKKIVMDSHNFIEQVMIPHCTCFVTRNIYDEYGSFNLKYRYIADYDMIYRFYKERTNYNIEFTPVYKILSNFTLGGLSSTYPAIKETLKFKHEKGFINMKEFYMLLMREKLRRLFV